MYKRTNDYPQSHDLLPARKPVLRGILPAPDVVKRILAYQAVRDHSHRELADKLNLEGLRDGSGALWTGSSVSAALQGQLVETLSPSPASRPSGKSRSTFRADGRPRVR